MERTRLREPGSATDRKAGSKNATIGCDKLFVAKMTKRVTRRSVHAGPKQTQKRDTGRRAKLSSKHALEVSRRRARVAELAAGGLDLRQCESWTTRKLRIISPDFLEGRNEIDWMPKS